MACEFLKYESNSVGIIVKSKRYGSPESFLLVQEENNNARPCIAASIGSFPYPHERKSLAYRLFNRLLSTGYQ